MLLPGFLLTANPCSDIDYYPKMLDKELGKRYGCKSYQRNEIQMSTDGTQNGKFFEILCDDSLRLYLYMGRVNSCRQSGCSSGAVVSPGETSEYFDYFVLFNNHNKIVCVRIYNYAATYGHGVCATGWLKQFEGYAYSPEKYIGEGIDAISGATVSVNAIITDLQIRSEEISYYKK